MYDRAAALAPEWSKPHVNRGVLRMAQGRPREAIASFEAALSRDPGNGQVRLWKGDAQLKMGRAGEALRTYRSIENQPRVAAQATTRIGQIYLEGQQLDAALKAFNRAQDLAPQDPEPVAGIAEAQVSAGNYGAAAEAYHRALRLTKSGGLISTRPILYRALAEAQLSARDPDAAARTLERALAEEPQNAPLWHRLRAQAFFDKGDGRAGEAALRDALDAETGRYPLETLHAIAARNLLGRIGHACRAELSGPRRAEALAVLAHLARYGGQADEEIRLRQQVTELRDQGVDHLLLANAYEQTGQAQKARDAYRRALALGGLSEPDQDRARLRLRQLTAPTTSPAGSRKR
jgi:tetratricopeptide (TPR) repeat protein